VILLGKSRLDLIEQVCDQTVKINHLSEVVAEQSKIIVSLAYVQSDLAESISKIESLNLDTDCFILKIPLRLDDISN
jgi:uncharacterized coiled-coil protein SlyX